jgi:hypothetical protein
MYLHIAYVMGYWKIQFRLRRTKMAIQVFVGVASCGFDVGVDAAVKTPPVFNRIGEGFDSAMITSISASTLLSRVGGVAFREVGVDDDDGLAGTVVLRLHGFRIMSGMLSLILQAHSLLSSKQRQVCHL